MKRNSFFKSIISPLQDYYFLSGKGLLYIVKRPFYLRDLLEQMDYAGAGSMIIILLVSLFVGMALSLQIAAELSVLGLNMYTGRIVGISIISEIGPVVSALVFAGRAGSGMASELGTMVLRHQVDTLRVFGVDPVKKLIVPRLLAAFIMLPALTLIGDASAILGGYYINTFISHASGAVYWSSMRFVMLPRYLIAGSVKPFLFGLIIASISCYTGFSTKGGAIGLKSSTTRAFVFSTILIIVFDFLTTKLILMAFGLSS